MPAIRDRAVVLKRLDYSESSQVVALYTRDHGKVRVIAKGARRSTGKRFKPGLELLEAGDVVFSVRHVGQESLAPLSEWAPDRAFLGLRERLDRLQAAQYAADATAHLTEDWDRHPALFESLEGILDALCDASDVILALCDYQRTLLEEVGLAPRLDGCVGCGLQVGGRGGGDACFGGDVYFSSFEGGLLCRDCEPARVEKRLVRTSVDRLARWVGEGGRESLMSGDRNGVFDLLHYHLCHAMGRAPAGGAAMMRLLNP
jgi:DNA repair protein RecO (recombination protein O)